MIGTIGPQTDSGSSILSALLAELPCRQYTCYSRIQGQALHQEPPEGNQDEAAQNDISVTDKSDAEVV